MLRQTLIAIFLLVCLRETNAYADDKDKALHFLGGYAVSFTATKIFQVIGIKKGPAAILGTLVGTGATVGKELSDAQVSKEDLMWGSYGAASSGIINISLDILD